MKNFVIVDGKAYSIKDEKGILITFSLEGEAKLDESQTIEIKGNQEKFTYDEIYKKLNIAYQIEEAKKEQELRKKYEKMNSQKKIVAETTENKEEVEETKKTTKKEK